MTPANRGEEVTVDAQFQKTVGKFVSRGVVANGGKKLVSRHSGNASCCRGN